MDRLFLSLGLCFMYAGMLSSSGCKSATMVTISLPSAQRVTPVIDQERHTVSLSLSGVSVMQVKNECVRVCQAADDASLMGIDVEPEGEGATLTVRIAPGARVQFMPFSGEQHYVALIRAPRAASDLYTHAPFMQCSRASLYCA